MPTYIQLIRYTQKGVENMRDSPNRLENAKKFWASQGGKLNQFFLTMGQYDAVVIGEAPSDEAATKIALVTGGLGFVRTETLRAYTEDEYRKIIAALP